jgi:D-alanyl-D-alanine carboxypeptidase
MTPKRTILFIITFAFLVKPGFAQTFNKAKMDSLFDVLAANNKAMMSIAITKNGQPLYSNAIGYSWYSAQKTPATLQTKYRIGSISKVFTAVMIFQLIEEGKLKLTTPLSQFYPALPNAAKITIAHMLNHSSGIHSITADTSYGKWLNTKVTHDFLLAKMAPADFEPGAKHEYNNSNFVLLGYIVEKLDKKPYAVSLKNRITGKLGLKDTYYGGKISAANNEAYSYKWQGDWKPDTETDMSIPGGAGALVSNPADLTKFMEALFDGKLISTISLTQMKTAEKGFGMNLFTFPFDNHTAYGHGGNIDGFQSQAAYFADDKIAVAYTANGVNSNFNNMMIGVLSIVFNKPYTIPDFKNTILKSEDLDKYLGVYATTQIPLKITITKQGAELIAQATGQSAFMLEADGNHQFKFEQAGVVLIFNPASSQMTLKQGGGTFVFTREK